MLLVQQVQTDCGATITRVLLCFTYFHVFSCSHIRCKPCLHHCDITSLESSFPEPQKTSSTSRVQAVGRRVLLICAATFCFFAVKGSKGGPSVPPQLCGAAVDRVAGSWRGPSRRCCFFSAVGGGKRWLPPPHRTVLHQGSAGTDP